MIESISIQNFLSFKEKQTLSFVASNKEKNKDNIISPNWYKEIEGGKKLLKLLILVGENGSGKTNLLQAIRYIREIALSKKNDRSEEIKYWPFLFDNCSKSMPTEMSILYYIGNENYQYSFKANATSILEEELKLISGKKTSRVYYRTIDDTSGLTAITFGSACDLNKTAQKDLQAKIISNRSVLSAFWGRNMESKVMRKNYDFFENHLSKVHKSEESLADRLFYYENEDGDKMRSLVKQIMADICSNIVDYRVVESVIDLEKEVTDGMPEPLKEMLIKQYPDGIMKNKSLSFIHKTDNGDFELPEGMESDGTLEILKLMIVVYDIVLGHKYSFVDELGYEIHSKALNFIIRMFLMLSNDSQLVVASQDLLLLDIDYLRRDSVRWLKKDSLGNSNIEYINQNKVHKNKNLRSYLYDEMLNEMNGIMNDETVFGIYKKIIENPT